MKFFRLVSEYRWPIYIAGHLTMSVVACGVLVWVATRPDAPRPIPDYYQSAQSWDADEATIDASRALGWSVRYELPADVPYVPGTPRPIDVTVTDRTGQPVTGLSGRLVAIRPSDSRLTQSAVLIELPAHAGNYRTLVRLDEPGAWDIRLDTKQQALPFVHAARITVPDGHGALGAASP
jgi:nitrogen fixation protein FixH